MTDDETLILNSAQEIAGKHIPMEVIWQPAQVVQIVGLLQLALRHPAVSPVHDRLARRFIEGARQYFADCPTVLDLIARGYDSSQDRART